MSAKPEAVIHVDLDGAPHIFGYHGWEYDRPEDPLFASGMPNLLAFMERNRIRATLFVIACDLEEPDKRRWIERAVAAGHEIASHSLTHADFDRIDREQKRLEVFESRKRLEACLGTEVRGFRAPGYRIDRETLELLAESGYAYDSSAFPTSAFARRLELHSIEPSPHAVGNGSLMELPLPNHWPLPFPFHPSYSLVLGSRYFGWGLGLAARRGHPLVLLYHLIDFAGPLPAATVPGLKRRVFTLSHRSEGDKLSRCQSILDHTLERFELSDTRSVLARHEKRPS